MKLETNFSTSSSLTEVSAHSITVTIDRDGKASLILSEPDEASDVGGRQGDTASNANTEPEGSSASSAPTFKVGDRVRSKHRFSVRGIETVIAVAYVNDMQWIRTAEHPNMFNENGWVAHAFELVEPAPHKYAKGDIVRLKSGTLAEVKDVGFDGLVAAVPSAYDNLYGPTYHYYAFDKIEFVK